MQSYSIMENPDTWKKWKSWKRKEQRKELAKSHCGKDKLLQEEDSVLCEQAEQIVLSA